jgi:hypothetical protein
MRDDRPTGEVPTTCPYGDPLGEGGVLVGWFPCGCPAALDNHRGHRTYSCQVCREKRRWKTVCYSPPHLGGGHPVSRR